MDLKWAPQVELATFEKGKYHIYITYILLIFILSNKVLSSHLSYSAVDDVDVLDVQEDLGLHRDQLFPLIFTD